MNCPKCGQPEQTRVKVCPGCGETYASEDLQTMRQLEYLLQETAAWEGMEEQRSPYQEKLDQLRARVVRPEPPITTPTPVPDQAAALATPEESIQAEPAPTAPPAAAVVQEPPAEKVAPKEKVPFDEWLLSERNIKFALYGGGVLLFIAGIIFVGINWARLSGPIKFAVTLLITGLTFLGGYLLHKQPAYRLGGTALIGLACAFLTLNFAVLQIYVTGPEGMQDEVMWLIASPICLIIYFLIGYWTREELFGYLTFAALASLIAAALYLFEVGLMVAVLASTLFALFLLLLALLFRRMQIADFMHRPYLIVAHAAMPLAMLFALIMWVGYTGCTMCSEGSPWLPILSLFIGVIFYTITNLTYKWFWARWAALALFSLAVVLALFESGIDDTIAGLSLMTLALLHLFAGYGVQKREGQLMGALPFYAMAGVLAMFVTRMVLVQGDTDDLIKVLFGDVLLLAVAAWVFHDYRWVYGAAWLFMVPVYLLINTYVDESAYQGLLLGLLGINYVVVGFVLGRREKHLSWPFLTAAAFLSLVVPLLTWSEPWIFALSTAVIAVIYALMALWLEWPWLLAPALLGLDLAILGINRAAYPLETPIEPALIISSAFAGGALILGGLALRRMGHSPWSWPLYLFGAIDLALAYAGGLVIGGWLAVGMSAVVALFLLAFAWLERDLFEQQKLPSLLTYLAAGVILGGFVYLLDTLGGSQVMDDWPPYIAGLCAIYMLLSWLLRRDPLGPVYGTPLRHAALALSVIPLIGALIIFDPVLGAITFAIAGLIYAADSVQRGSLGTAYLAAGAFLVVIWAILMAFDVSEPLAYAAPLGFGLLAIGWNENRHGRKASYMLPTLLGLLVLIGTTFAMSILEPDGYYALLLLLESVAAFAWGMTQRVRCYIQIAALALVANAVVQLGPGFLELHRWIQIGVAGGLLLGIGLIALFRREAILAARQKAADGWRQFQP
ncbi:MAG: hypothetical protein JSV68_10685 [Anaerolineaceae bacterium]|nr:MAG: hypothetical protein JSV68_10685 [Anaerolineaceae bacterium]